LRGNSHISTKPSQKYEHHSLPRQEFGSLFFIGPRKSSWINLGLPRNGVFYAHIYYTIFRTMAYLLLRNKGASRRVHYCRISNGNGEMDSLAGDTLKIPKMLPAHTCSGCLTLFKRLLAISANGMVFCSPLLMSRNITFRLLSSCSPRIRA